MRKRFHGRCGGLVIAIAAALLLAGCGSASYSSSTADTAAAVQTASSSYATDGYYDYGSGIEEEYAAETESAADSTEAAAENRKLIKTVNLSVETKEFDTLMASLEERVQTLGGYIESMDTYNGSAYSSYRSSRSASLTIRIPQERLSGFLDEVSGICNVIRRSESVEDVTLTYVDLETHRNALETERDRLLELMEQAETMDDILTIEERLTDVRYQLQSMESQLRVMDNQVDYSTVYLEVDEVQELTPVAEQSIGERIAEGFSDSLKDVGTGFREFFIWFIVNLPHLVIWAVVIALIVLIIRKIRKRRKAKKQAKPGKPFSQPAEEKETGEGK
jgi:hypothetical protein